MRRAELNPPYAPADDWAIAKAMVCSNRQSTVAMERHHNARCFVKSEKCGPRLVRPTGEAWPDALAQRPSR